LPVEAGFYNTPGYAYGVAVSDSYAYVAYDEAGLRIINISNPALPVEAGFYDTPGYAFGVAVSGRFAYVADFEAGLRIIDISNPVLPVEAGFYNTPGYAYGVAVSDSYAYVADADHEVGGLRIYQGYGPAGIANEQVGETKFKVESLKLKVAGNKISYQLPQSGVASLKIYNLLGQEVRTLANEFKGSGVYSLQWNGRDAGGRRISSGVYLVRLEVNGQAVTGKMLVVR
jgi:hypothetical protein